MPGTVNYQNHEPVWVAFNDVNLGLCAEGDITVTVPREWVFQNSHQTGGAAIDAYFKGGTPTVQCNFIEINNWDMWEIAFPVGEKQRDSATPPAARGVGLDLASSVLGRYVGHHATTYAQRLVLIPEQLYTASSAQTVRDWFFPKAFCSNVGDVLFGVDSPNALNLTFSVLFDPSNQDGGNQFGRGLRTPSSGSWTVA